MCLCCSKLYSQIYTYDSGGRITQAVYANGTAITYGYDTDGNLNSIATNAVAASLPQLAYDTDYLSASAIHPGNVLNPSVTIANDACSGTGYSAGSFHVGFYGTANVAFTNVTFLGAAPVGGCAANSTVTISPNIALSPATPVGTYYFAYIIDPSNEVAECSSSPNGYYYYWTLTITAGPPPIAANSSGTNIVLTWPTNTTGVLLEYTTNLASKTWVTNTAGFYVTNGQYVITNGMAKGSRFYRLLKP
jgi:YD repeat-containing protein